MSNIVITKPQFEILENVSPHYRNMAKATPKPKE